MTVCGQAFEGLKGNLPLWSYHLAPREQYLPQDLTEMCPGD